MCVGGGEETKKVHIETSEKPGHEKMSRFANTFAAFGKDITDSWLQTHLRLLSSPSGAMLSILYRTLYCVNLLNLS